MDMSKRYRIRYTIKKPLLDYGNVFLGNDNRRGSNFQNQYKHSRWVVGNCFKKKRVQKLVVFILYKMLQGDYIDVFPSAWSLASPLQECCAY